MRFLSTLLLVALALRAGPGHAGNRLEDYGNRHVQALHEFPVFLRIDTEMSLAEREELVAWLGRNGFVRDGGSYDDRDMKIRSVDNFAYKDLISLSVSMPTRNVVVISAFGILDHEKGLKEKLRHVAAFPGAPGRVRHREVRIAERYSPGPGRGGR